MTQRRRKHGKKWLGKLLFVILLIIAVIVCYFVWDGYFREKDKLEDAPKNEETEKVEEGYGGAEGQPVELKEEIVQYEGKNPNEEESITGAITYASISGENLMIRINIDQYLSSGNCELTLKRDGKIIFEDSAAVMDAVSTSTCEGFNVPVAELGSGQVVIDVFVKSGDKSGTISGEVKL